MDLSKMTLSELRGLSAVIGDIHDNTVHNG